MKEHCNRDAMLIVACYSSQHFFFKENTHEKAPNERQSKYTYFSRLALFAEDPDVSYKPIL